MRFKIPLVLLVHLFSVFHAIEIQAAPFVCPVEEEIHVRNGWYEELRSAFDHRRLQQIIRLLEEAEHTGSPGVLLQLGRLYEWGLGDFPSEEARGRKVLSLYTKAAFCRDMHAILELAAFYNVGHAGVPVDEHLADCLGDEALSQSRDITECGIFPPDQDD